MRLSATLRYLATGKLISRSHVLYKNCSKFSVTNYTRNIASYHQPMKKKIYHFHVSQKIGKLWKAYFFRPPHSEGSKYCNYKGRDSIILLALVEADYKFIFVDIGKNGRAHDSTVFREMFLPGFNFEMPYVIVGDDAFPLHVNLMEPYLERDLTQDKRIFNYRLSRTRRVSENAFGILANRFRILLNSMILAVEKVEIITHACVLHNFFLNKKVRSYIPSKYRNENSETFESRLCSEIQ
ncbi:hypothetical protein ACFW04_012271 [Cataglyphis niger]